MELYQQIQSSYIYPKFYFITFSVTQTSKNTLLTSCLRQAKYSKIQTSTCIDIKNSQKTNKIEQGLISNQLKIYS